MPRITSIVHTVERNRPFHPDEHTLADHDASIGQHEGLALPPDAIETECHEVLVQRDTASGPHDERDRFTAMEAKPADLRARGRDLELSTSS